MPRPLLAPAGHMVCRVRQQQFFWDEGERRWRETTTLPAAGDSVHTLSDPDAQKANKRETGRVGGRVHLSEIGVDTFPT